MPAIGQEWELMSSKDDTREVARLLAVIENHEWIGEALMQLRTKQAYEAANPGKEPWAALVLRDLLDFFGDKFRPEHVKKWVNSMLSYKCVLEVQNGNLERLLQEEREKKVPDYIEMKVAYLRAELAGIRDALDSLNGDAKLNRERLGDVGFIREWIHATRSGIERDKRIKEAILGHGFAEGISWTNVFEHIHALAATTRPGAPATLLGIVLDYAKGRSEANPLVARLREAGFLPKKKSEGDEEP